MGKFFEDGDIRTQVLAYLDKDELTDAEASEVSDLYRSLCMMCFEKLKGLIEDNPYRALALVLLAQPKTSEALTTLYSKVHEDYGEFTDLLISVLLMRRLEERGSVESPFTVSLDKIEEEDNGGADI